MTVHRYFSVVIKLQNPYFHLAYLIPGDKWTYRLCIFMESNSFSESRSSKKSFVAFKFAVNICNGTTIFHLISHTLRLHKSFFSSGFFWEIMATAESFPANSIYHRFYCYHKVNWGIFFRHEIYFMAAQNGLMICNLNSCFVGQFRLHFWFRFPRDGTFDWL